MNTKPIRIQFEITPAFAEEISKFEEEAGVLSHREFFGNLLTLWRWAAKRTKEGKMIAAIDAESGKYNELTMPTLDSVRQYALSEKALELSNLVPSETATESSLNPDLTGHTA